MLKLLKNLALLTLSIAIVLVGLGVMLQQYMQSEEFIEKISKTSSEAVGGHVGIQTVRLSLLRGFSLGDISITSKSGDSDKFLKVQGAFLEYNLFSLLLRRLELTSILLDSPVLHFKQSPDGTWWFPQKKTESAPPTLDTGLLSFDILLNNLRLSGGSVAVSDNEGISLFTSDKIDIDGNFAAGELGSEASGQVTVGDLRFGPYFQMKDMKSGIKYEDEVLNLPNLTGSAYNGSVGGSIEIDLRIGDPKFTLVFNLDSLRLPEIIRDFQGKSEWLTGELSALCRITGGFEQPELMQGTGTLSISNGSFRGLGFLQEISHLLPNSDLPETVFEKITGNFKIADKKLTIYNMEAVSDAVQLTGTGPITFSREVEFDMRLSLAEELALQLPEDVLEKFKKRDDNSYSITFQLTGSLDNPISNLGEKLRLSDRIQPVAVLTQ